MLAKSPCAHITYVLMRAPTALLVLLIALIGLSGCNTFDRRAQEKADVFATLSPEDQARLEQKVIRVGDTTDMVYIALGHPDERRQTATADGETIAWIYNRYWQEYRGEAHSGFVRHVITNSKTGATSVYFEPVSRPVYAQRQQPVLRIFFANGLVSVIEQADNR